MTPDDVWRVAIIAATAVVVLVIGITALLSWPLLQLARQWMWIATVWLLSSIAFLAVDALNGWRSPWRLPSLLGAVVAMGIGFAIQAREAWKAWKVRRTLGKLR